ncbi:hypothetical protein Tco_0045991 [Tanacetum coccineum]
MSLSTISSASIDESIGSSASIAILSDSDDASAMAKAMIAALPAGVLDPTLVFDSKSEPFENLLSLVDTLESDSDAEPLESPATSDYFITILKTSTLYPSRKIRRIRACTHQRPQRIKAQYAISRETQYAVCEYSGRYQAWSILQEIPNTPYPILGYAVKMDDPNITIEEYIRLEEEKARRRTIVFNDTLMYEPTVSSINDEIDFRVSFDDSDDENCTVILDKNSFSYKIIYVNNLKTDSKNDNDKVNMPLLPSPKPTVSYFHDLDFFKDFEKEFLAIVYNDAQTSKLDLLTEPILNPQHIDEFNLKDETSFSECDEEEQNILYFNDLFTFNVVYPNDLKSDKDNDDKIDIKQSSWGPRERNINEYWWRIYKSGDLEVLES